MRVAITTAAMLLASLPALAQDDAARRAATEVRAWVPFEFSQDDAARRAATEVAARVPFEKAIKGAPYTADTVIEGTQALADGNRINRKTTGRVYRDGEGRSRREEDRPNGTMSISIVDPVGGSSYSLDTINKIAWRTPIGVGGAIMGKIEAAQQPAVTMRRQVEPVRTTNPDGSTTVSNKVTYVETTRAEAEKIQAENARIAGSQDAQSRAARTEQEKVEQEKVEVARVAGAGGGARGRGGAVAPASGGGARGGGGGRGGAIARVSEPGVVPVVTTERKTLDGVAVEGRKTTSVIPAGQIGNEQPITIVSEEWRSPELNVLVMTRHADPRSGESIYRLTNIVRAEPDPSLFMVPPDYTVKDTGIRKMLEASIRK